MRIISISFLILTLGLAACASARISEAPQKSKPDEAVARPPQNWSVEFVETIALSHSFVRIAASSSGVAVNGRTVPKANAQQLTDLFLAVNWDEVLSSPSPTKKIGEGYVSLRVNREGTVSRRSSIPMWGNVNALLDAVHASMILIEQGTELNCSLTPPRPKCIPDHSEQCAKAYTAVWIHEITCPNRE